jgi:hypothetical protein
VSAGILGCAEVAQATSVARDGVAVRDDALTGGAVVVDVIHRDVLVGAGVIRGYFRVSHFFNWK